MCSDGMSQRRRAYWLVNCTSELVWVRFVYVFEYLGSLALLGMKAGVHYHGRMRPPMARPSPRALHGWFRLLDVSVAATLPLAHGTAYSSSAKIAPEHACFSDLLSVLQFNGLLAISRQTTKFWPSGRSPSI